MCSFQPLCLILHYFIFERKMSKERCFHGKRRENMKSASGNRPFLVTFVPRFQNESSCKTFHMKMSLICVKMNLYMEFIFKWMVFHEDSFWHRVKWQLGTWTLWMASSPRSSLTCSRCRSLERIPCITCECDRTSCVVIGRRLCAINWCTNRLTVDRCKKWKKERTSFSDKALS